MMIASGKNYIYAGTGADCVSGARWLFSSWAQLARDWLREELNPESSRSR